MSTFSFISDIHVKTSTDHGAKVLNKFLQNETVLNSKNIYFLGDIFDHLIGEKKDYLEVYKFFFKSVVKLLDKGVRVTYLEGNHDFHFENIFTQFVLSNTKNSSLFHYCKDGGNLSIGSKVYYFCHGDEVDYTNEAFKRWKKVYRSKAFQIFVNKIIPAKLVLYLGEKASSDSKKRGQKKFNIEKARVKYLEGAKKLIDEKKVDGIIAGHTHIPELHSFADGQLYINCGFPQKHNHFIHFDETNFKKVSLD